MRRLSSLLLVGILSASASAQRADTQRTVTQEQDFEKLDRLMEALRTRNARDYAVTGPEAIDEGRYVEIGGIRQWITIRGENRGNPVVLFLHGGPGDATNPWSYAVFRPWLKAFTVVQWDQRGTGRTFGANGKASEGPISVDRMTQDGVELADLIRTTLRKDKIILVGHSWGSILGMRMVRTRPDLFYAYVGTGQVANPTRNYAVAYDALLKTAEARNEQRALAELRQVGPPPYSNGRGYAVQRKWANFFEGSDVFIASMLGLALGAPGYTLKDLNDWVDGQGVSGQALIPQTNAIDAKTFGGEYAVPIFVIQGAQDLTTPTMLARELMNSIRAPRKVFVAVEGGGHFAVFMKSDVFLRELVTRVRPLALVGSGSI